MSASNYNTPLWADTYASGHGSLCERPSPLRIVKYDSNKNKDKRHTMDQPRCGSAKHRQIVQGDGTLTVAKRRKVDPERMTPDKENLGIIQHDQSLKEQGNQSMYEANYWAQHDRPSPRPGATPLSQLSVKKTRQTHTYARVQFEQGYPSPSLSASTLPAAYYTRRPMKARPPLTNMYDGATMFEEEAKPILHITGQEEMLLRSNERPKKSTAIFNDTRQPRLVHLLTPHVSITPEVTALEKGCHLLWAAIEISVAPWLSPEKIARSENHREQPGLSKDLAWLPNHDQEIEDTLEAGGLFDLNIEVLPTEYSSIFVLPRDRDLGALSRNGQGSSAVRCSDRSLDVKLTIFGGHCGQSVRANKGVASGCGIHHSRLGSREQCTLTAVVDEVDAASSQSDNDITNPTIDEDTTNAVQTVNIIKLRLGAVGKDGRFCLINHEMG
ncbi:hypothetical protein HG530_009859 [Fusarium avenaceum]|nr:hypothetical protein HG530_009859 [Fusarium avenaceum]